MISGAINRRNFLCSLGGLTIGFSLTGIRLPLAGRELGTLADDSRIDAWIQLPANGNLRVFTGKLELGQGIKTAIKQVAAEELDFPMERTELLMAETGATPDEGYTAGSRSIESSAMSVRKAAAYAREKLITLAAEEWKVQEASVRCQNGQLVHDDRSVPIHDFLKGRKLSYAVGEPKEIKGKTVRNLVGKPIAREDIAAMVRGTMIYVQDLRFENMVHGRVIHPPSYSSSLASLDTTSVANDPGLLKLVQDGSFLGIIASSEWAAIRLREKIGRLATWSTGTPLPDEKSLKEYLLSLEVSTETDESKDDTNASLGKATIRHSATYFKPYIMHAANGPSCAVARYEDDKLEIWTHSQGVYPLRSSIAAMMHIPEERIHVKGVPGSGCYGHNGADDVAAEAALLARKIPGRHVRLQWMRDDEHGWEPYGTAMVMKLEAGINASGRISAWRYDLWSDGHSSRPGGDPGSLLPARYISNSFPAPEGGFRGGATRNAPPCYETESLQVRSHIFHGPLRTSALRGLGAYANIFAIESFMDELAEKAGKDPVAFRLEHLADPRAKECLERLRKKTKSTDTPGGTGMGYAFSRYKNDATYCAVAALISMDLKKGLRVEKMWAVVDAGEVINSDGLKNQIEGGMIQSASWAMNEEVHFDQQHTTSLDWYSYPVYRYGEVPHTDVEIIDRPDQPPLGAGEAAQGPATAAVVNAIYRATGKRHRDLPVRSG